MKDAMKQAKRFIDRLRNDLQQQVRATRSDPTSDDKTANDTTANDLTVNDTAPDGTAAKNNSDKHNSDKNNSAKNKMQNSNEFEDHQIATAVLLMVGSTFLTKTADTLASPKIVLTALLQSMGASSLAISVLVPLRESGALVPQIWLAGIAARCRRLGLLYRIGACVQGIAALCMLMSVWLLEGRAAGWAIVACLAALSVARALCSISFKGVLGKIVPGGLRGQTTGWASSAAGVATILIALTLIVLPNTETVGSLAAFLGFAALCWWLAAALFRFIDEKENREFDGEHDSAIKRLGLLRKDPAFQRFVIARSCLVSTALVAPWYVLLSVSANAALGSIGSLLLASGLASFLSAPFWGRYSDRSSRWVLQMSAAGVMALGAITVLLYVLLPELFTALWLVPMLYFVLQIAHQGVRVGRKTYVVDLANDGNRVDYVSISNTIIGVIILVIGVLTGIVSIWLPPIGMIALFSVGSGIGAWTAASLPEAQEPEAQKPGAQKP